MRCARSAWVGHSGPSVCPEHNSKTNDAKMFTLGTENDLGISYKWYGFGLKGQRSRLGLGLGLTAIRTL